MLLHVSPQWRHASWLVPRLVAVTQFLARIVGWYLTYWSAENLRLLSVPWIIMYSLASNLETWKRCEEKFTFGIFRCDPHILAGCISLRPISGFHNSTTSRILVGRYMRKHAERNSEKRPQKHSIFFVQANGVSCCFLGGAYLNLPRVQHCLSMFKSKKITKKRPGEEWDEDVMLLRV